MAKKANFGLVTAPRDRPKKDQVGTRKAQINMKKNGKISKKVVDKYPLISYIYRKKGKYV